jgi:hypothetical protein
MKQCLLIRGNRRQIAWLPVKFAVAGKFVRLHDVDGWKVSRVFHAYQENVDVPHGYLSGGVFHK